MTPSASISGALIEALQGSPLGLPTAFENMPFVKPTGRGPWAAVFYLPNQPGAASLGSTGEDAHDGVLQIDLNYPLQQGTSAVNAKADALATFFKTGTRLTRGAVRVWVTSCGRSRGREVDGWYRVSITLAWAARVPRN